MVWGVSGRGVGSLDGVGGGRWDDGREGGVTWIGMKMILRDSC